MAKRFDRNFKVTGQQDARGHLYIFAGVPLDDSIEVTPLDKDLSVPGFLVDDCYILSGPSGPRIKHLEAELRWHAEIPRHMGRYMQALDLKLEMPVDSILVLLTPANLPDPIPQIYQIDRAPYRAELRFEVVKLWEVDAGAILELGRPSLLPWVALMKATDSEMRRAGGMVAEDRILSDQFLTLAELNPRYNRTEILGLLGRNTMLLKDSILEQSPYLQGFIHKALERGLEQGLEQGLERGLEQGLERGLENGERKALLGVLDRLMTSRFKGVQISAEVKRFETKKLQLLVDQLIAADGKDAARKILRDL